MTIALNVIVTIFIVCRLLVYRWRVTRVMGPGQTSEYATMTAILIESAIMYSSFAILFIVPFGIGNPLGNVFLQAVSQVQVCTILSTTLHKGFSEHVSVDGLLTFDCLSASLGARMDGKYVRADNNETRSK